jgi:hypothetical protein
MQCDIEGALRVAVMVVKAFWHGGKQLAGDVVRPAFVRSGVALSSCQSGQKKFHWQGFVSVGAEGVGAGLNSSVLVEANWKFIDVRG